MSYSWFLLAIAVLWSAPQRVLAQTVAKSPVLEKIFADWKERQGLVKNARYVITGTTEFKDKNLPPGNSVRPVRLVLLLDIERQRWRFDSSEEGIREDARGHCTFIPRVGTSAFDGSALQHYYHRDLNGIEGKDAVDLSISKGQLQRGGPCPVTLYPVFFAHGIVITARDTELRQHELPTTYDPEFFEVQAERLSYHGHSCAVLHTMPLPYISAYFDELWVDKGEMSAIQRYVEFSGKTPCNRLDVDWKRTNVGWWPNQWTLTWTVNDKVQRIHRLRIDSFEPNGAVADAEFKLEAKPGMIVEVADSPPPGPGMDPNFVPARTYLVSPSGSWQELSAKGYTTLKGNVLPYERSRTWLWWTAAITTAIAATIFCSYYALLRKRKLRPDQP